MPVTSNLRFLLQRRGRTATLERVTGSTYDPETGSNTETTLGHTIKAYFAEYNLGEEANSEVATGKRWVAVSTVDTSGDLIPKPDTEDRIVDVEDTVVVSKVQTIYNGETPVVYLCTVQE